MAEYSYAKSTIDTFQQSASTNNGQRKLFNTMAVNKTKMNSLKHNVRISNRQ
jgi:hypothetical protein